MAFTDTATEAAAMPDPAGCHELLSVVDPVAAAGAALISRHTLLSLTARRVEIYQWSGFLELTGPCGHESGDGASPTVAVPVRTVVFAVAGLAKYFAVRGVAARGAVQGPLALQAGEAALVEAEVPGQHAFRVEHFPVASGTGFLVICSALYAGRVGH